MADELVYEPDPDSDYYLNEWLETLRWVEQERRDTLDAHGGLTEAERRRRGLTEMPGRGVPSTAPPPPASVSPHEEAA